MNPSYRHTDSQCHMLGVFVNGYKQVRVAVIAETPAEAVAKLRDYGARNLPDYTLDSHIIRNSPATKSAREIQCEGYARKWEGKNQEIGRAK